MERTATNRAMRRARNLKGTLRPSCHPVPQGRAYHGTGPNGSQRPREPSEVAMQISIPEHRPKQRRELMWEGKGRIISHQPSPVLPPILHSLSKFFRSRITCFYSSNLKLSVS
jgi:hypothetical protein